MFRITSDPVFDRDYRRIIHSHPWIKGEFSAAVQELASSGRPPKSYGAHILDNPGGNHNGHIDFHLSDGQVDVVVLYMPHKSNPEIRFVRMGTHEELFQGPNL